jgi:hypothetical protein
LFSGSFIDRDLDVVRQAIVHSSSSNRSGLLSTYLQSVNSQSISLRKQQTVEVIRFEPSAQFSSISVRKTIVINNLMPFYRNIFPEAHFAFTNYHSLNFVTGSGLPSDTAFIYADPDRQYAITGAFSFDFWINPKTYEILRMNMPSTTFSYQDELGLVAATIDFDISDKRVNQVVSITRPVNSLDYSILKKKIDLIVKAKKLKKTSKDIVR